MKSSVPKSLCETPHQYQRILDAIDKCSISEQQGHLHWLGLNDLYFYIRFLLGRGDLYDPPDPASEGGQTIWLSGDAKPGFPEEGPKDEKLEKKLLEERRERWRRFCFDRCREVQADPDGMLDLWARGHYKTTIITYGYTSQELLQEDNENIATGIFSEDNPTAEPHLITIKDTFTENALLKELFQDRLWERPEVEAPLWSVQKGITLKRKRPRKEPTLSAWGIDALPVGFHFDRMIYDDVVTKESVRTPEQIKKTTGNWDHSLFLRAAGARVRGIGTKYHLYDTYQVIEKRGTLRVRRHPVEDPETKEPAMMHEKEVDAIRKHSEASVFASQMMQDPRADTTMGFSRDWIATTRYMGHARDIRKGQNVYQVYDPANSKKADADYTAGWTFGLGADLNYYCLDFFRERVNLTEFADIVFEWHRTWQPLTVGIEQYGLQAHIEHIQERQHRVNYRFPIIPLGGKLRKEERIRRLGPLYQAGRIWLPGVLHKTVDGQVVDMVDVFIQEEYAAFPVGAHDDMLDAKSRILDPELGAKFPSAVPERTNTQRKRKTTGWMGK